MPVHNNPLLDDRFVHFLMNDVLDAATLCELPGYAHHSKETFDLYLDSCRKLARQDFLPTYKAMDEEPPTFTDGKITTHAALPALWQKMVDLGILTATRPEEVGGQEIPGLVHTLASAYLMAANLSVYGYAGLTVGAAHLIEAFGSDELKTRFMRPMYDGDWTGTMALTEPQAGSSLADVVTTARPTDDGYYLIKGSKIFISGADHTVTDNTVNLTLARIEGAPPGTKGISLFAIPRLRDENGTLVSNDVTTAGMIHKIGWKGLPSLALEFGDQGDCRGWLVGEPHQGLRYMFQMMNEARLMIGVNGAATASVAYHEARLYALERKQGRAPGTRGGEPVPIVAHSDVRRMLLRQKAIVEGAFALLAKTARYGDVAKHAQDAHERERAFLLLDLLTPVAKTFPAEKGFEANVLAVQVHGGYGYTSEYLPEAFMRDQKLNTLHEGTSGIQSMDLLGRKVVAKGGAALTALGEEIALTVARAKDAGCPESWCDAVTDAIAKVGKLTAELGARGMAGDVNGMMAHSFDYLDLFATVVVAWQWLDMAAVAHAKLANGSSQDDDQLRGVVQAAQYWIASELPRIDYLAALCRDNEDSYLKLDPAWL